MGDHEEPPPWSSEAAQEYGTRSQIRHSRQDRALWCENPELRRESDGGDATATVPAVAASCLEGGINDKTPRDRHGGEDVWGRWRRQETTRHDSQPGHETVSRSEPLAVAEKARHSRPLVQSLPYLLHTEDCVPALEQSNVSLEHDLGDQTSPPVPSSARRIAGNKESLPSEERRGGVVSTANACSSHMLLDDDENSITNSGCVPVTGRLTGLAHDAGSDGDDSDDGDEGGIMILCGSTEDEYAESMDDARRQHQQRLRDDDIAPPTDAANDARGAGSRIDNTTQAWAMHDTHSTAVAAAAALLREADPAPAEGYEWLDSELLQRGSGDRRAADAAPPQGEPEGEGACSWPRNPAAASPGRGRSGGSPPSRAPVRATRIGPDKYIVEIDIRPAGGARDASAGVREVMDVMANVERLHDWFDPVPAVFAAAVRDGSRGAGAAPPRGPAADAREHDGQWVEISTPPLLMPADARVSGCLRAAWVGLRSLVGFPSRVRSLVFVERGCGRVGMTLGPYPDGGAGCAGGTMAYHSLTVRRDAGAVGDGTGRRPRVMVADEVHIRRGGREEECFERARNNCCLAAAVRFLLGLLGRTCLAWHRPDVVSYMHQTVSSLAKLRALVERDDVARTVDGDGWDDGGAADGTLGAPLLG